MYIEAINFFKKLQELNEQHEIETIIAGGFCRDRLYGKDFKDVDIWMNCNYKQFNSEIGRKEIWWPELAELIGDNRFTKTPDQSYNLLYDVQYDHPYDGWDNPLDVNCKVDFTFEGVEYQIMMIEKPEDSEEAFGEWVIKQFDNSLCEAYYDVDFNTSKDFDDTMNDYPIKIKNFNDINYMLRLHERAIKQRDKLELKNRIIIDPSYEVSITKIANQEEPVGLAAADLGHIEQIADNAVGWVPAGFRPVAVERPIPAEVRLDDVRLGDWFDNDVGEQEVAPPPPPVDPLERARNDFQNAMEQLRDADNFARQARLQQVQAAVQEGPREPRARDRDGDDFRARNEQREGAVQNALRRLGIGNR